MNQSKIHNEDTLIHPLSRTLFNDLQGSSINKDPKYDSNSRRTLPMKRQALKAGMFETLSNAATNGLYPPPASFGNKQLPNCIQVRVQDLANVQTHSVKQDRQKTDIPLNDLFLTRSLIKCDQTFRPDKCTSHFSVQGSSSDKAPYPENLNKFTKSQVSFCDVPPSKDLDRRDKSSNKTLEEETKNDQIE